MKKPPAPHGGGGGKPVRRGQSWHGAFGAPVRHRTGKPAPPGGGGGPAGGSGTGQSWHGWKRGMPPKPVKKSKKPAAKKKPRKLSPGCDVACCSAQALGTLLGWDWQQVLDLYWLTAAGPGSGASIEGTLAAAGMAAASVLDERQPLSASPFHFRGRAALGVRDGDLHLAPAGHGLILGVTLPEPHALAVTPDGTWWSWGEPFNPGDWPDLTVDEAWAVTLCQP